MAYILYYQRCPRCGSLMKKIPIKRLGSKMVIELYCEKCNVSATYYPDKGKIKFKRPSIFYFKKSKTDLS